MARKRQPPAEAEPVDQYQDPAGPPLWSITRTEDSTMLSQTGGFQRSKKVYFVLNDGTSSYVEVPLSGFTKDTVASLIEQHVGNLLEVMTLQGPPVPPIPR